MASEADLGRGGGLVRSSPPGEVEPARRGGVFGFVHESWAELKKVEWPSQNQVIQGTVVVLVACIIVGTYLYVNDRIWQEVVKRIL